MRLAEFRISNYRNIIDFGWIGATDVTAIVGQNEAGKSNLFEALYCLHSYVKTRYDPDEDWPVEDWKGKKGANGHAVAQAYFDFGVGEADALFAFATAAPSDDDGTASEIAIATPPEEFDFLLSASMEALLGFSCMTGTAKQSILTSSACHKKRCRSGQEGTCPASCSSKITTSLERRLN